MASSEKISKDRLKGMLLGAIVPVVGLLVSSYFLLHFAHPLTINEYGFISVQKSYSGLLYDYLTSSSKYPAFFCVSANMPLVMYLTRIKQEYVANGVIIPTAIYALTLVVIRLLI